LVSLHGYSKINSRIPIYSFTVVDIPFGYPFLMRRLPLRNLPQCRNPNYNEELVSEEEKFKRIENN
jgi:hypothetical protein